jgi:hypothetical protein
MNTRAALVVAGNLMLGAAALVVGAGLAHADVYGSEGDMSVVALTKELRGDGVNQSIGDSVTLEHSVCGAQSVGYTRNNLIDRAAALYSVRAAVDGVMGSEYHFCPAYDSLHRGDNGEPILPGQYRPEPPPAWVTARPPGS